MNKEQVDICKALTAEWTREFLKAEATPLILLGAVNGTNMIAIASAPGIETDTILQVLRRAIEVVQLGKGGIITL